MADRSERKLLVIGGTGMLGRPVAKALAEAGHPVRLLVRHLEKAQESFGDQFEMTLGNVLAPETLLPAMQDCYGVHISLNSPPGKIDTRRVEDHGVQNVLEAASKAGVRQISQLNGATMGKQSDFDEIQIQQAGERALLESDLSAVSFRASWFFESVERMAKMGKLVVLGSDEPRFRWLAADDLARMVVELYGKDDPLQGPYPALGPEELPMGEVMERYREVLRPDLKVSRMSLGVARLLGPFLGAGFRFYARLMKHFEEVEEERDSSAADEVFGANETTLDQWLQRKKEAASS